MRKLLRATLILGFCAFSLSVSAQAVSDGSLPDPKVTPGIVRTTDKTDPVICGGPDTPKTSTKAQRKFLTGKIKEQSYAVYGMTSHRDKWCNSEQGCEVDHLISLELGGDPKDLRNLWPQPYEGPWNAHDKDRLENELHKRVCNDRMTLTDAQVAISTNWIQAYKDAFKVSEPIRHD